MGELEIPEELKEFADRIKILPFVDWKNLPKLISDVDINLAPLEDTILTAQIRNNGWKLPCSGGNGGVESGCICRYD